MKSRSSSARAAIRAWPDSVYLTALEARLSTIWRTRAASPCSASGHLRVDVDEQLERAAAQARAQHAGDRGQQPPRVVVLGLALGAPGLGAGDVERVAHEPAERLRGVGDHLGQLALALGQPGVASAAPPRPRCRTAAS